MTTYTVTITSSDYNYTYEDQSAAQVKQIKARYNGNKTMKVKAIKNIKCYYRGEEVTVVEEQYMGWTVVVAAGKSQFRAVTAELEYR